jgi:CubicO group peptidase (beta-lactamase class C family)
MAAMTDVHGTCSEAFELLRAEFEENLASGEELGGSVFVDLDGDTVVDLWGGYRDVDRTTPWTEDTITNVWSTTKTVTSLAALMLVDRGELDVYTPVARYWPEFAANGKENVEVRHLMAHTSGVSGWEQPFATEDMYDWEASTARLAAQAPWWEPGTASGYHAHNQGHLVGEVIRRVTGKKLKQFVADEIAGPLGADFQVGCKDSDCERIADVVPPPPLPFDLDALDRDSPMYKTFIGPPANAAAANTPAWRHADMGALNGHGNARSVARVSSAVTLGGEIDGVRLLSSRTIDLIFDEQIDGTDLVLGLPLRWGIGYALPQPRVHPHVPLPDGRICYWGGWGGSMAIMDLDRRMTIGYMMNKMAPGIIGSVRSAAYIRAAYRALGVETPVSATPAHI